MPELPSDTAKKPPLPDLARKEGKAQWIKVHLAICFSILGIWKHQNNCLRKKKIAEIIIFFSVSSGHKAVKK